MSPDIPEEILLKYSLQGAAVHEAGHAVAAAAGGASYCMAEVWRRKIRYPFKSRPIGGRVRRGRLSSKLKIAVVGFAGVAAELIHERPEIDAEDIMQWIEYGDIDPSPSDWKSIEQVPEKKQAEALARCVDLLREHWVAVLAVKTLLERDYKWHEDKGDRYPFASCALTPELLPKVNTYV